MEILGEHPKAQMSLTLRAQSSGRTLSKLFQVLGSIRSVHKEMGFLVLLLWEVAVAVTWGCSCPGICLWGHMAQG